MSARRRRPLRLVAAVAAALAAAAGVVVLASGSSGDPPASGSAGLARGPAPWPAEHRFLGTRVAALGLPGVSDAGFHIHAVLAVFVDGRRVPVPAGIGTDELQRFISPVHTHDATGVIHFEADRAFPFTLGQVFAVWGVRFTGTAIGGDGAAAGRRLAVFVDGHRVPDPVGYVVRPHDRIVVGYGRPGSFPTDIAFAFGPGL